MGEGETEPMEVENAPTPGGSTKCGAKTRRGKPCQSPPVRGKRRCRMHGGAPGSGAPFGRRNGNYRHGHFTSEAKEERRRLRSFDPRCAKNDEITDLRHCMGLMLNFARPSPSPHPVGEQER